MLISLCPFLSRGQSGTTGGNSSQPKMPIPSSSTKDKILSSDGKNFIWVNAPAGTNAKKLNVTNNKATFSYDSTAMLLNIPKQDKIIDNFDGTVTFDRGDNSGKDTLRVYLLDEPDYWIKLKGGTHTVLSSPISVNYTQNLQTKSLITYENKMILDTTGIDQIINLPNPGATNVSSVILCSKNPPKVTFNYPIYDRTNGVLYSSSVLVADNRDYSTISSLTMNDVMFKTRPYSQIVIINQNGKYFIEH